MNLESIYYSSIPQTSESFFVKKEIPDDLISEILSFLPQKDLINCSLVDTKWNKLSNFHYNWELFFNQSFPNTGLRVAHNQWRQLYIKKLIDSAPQLLWKKIDQTIPSNLHSISDDPNTSLNRPKLSSRYCMYGTPLCIAPVVVCAIYTLPIIFMNTLDCNQRGFNTTATNITTINLTRCDTSNSGLIRTYGPLLVSMGIANICFIAGFLFCLYKSYALEDHSSERSCSQLGKLSKEYVKDKCRSCNIL